MAFDYIIVYPFPFGM